MQYFLQFIQKSKLADPGFNLIRGPLTPVILVGRSGPHQVGVKAP